MTGSEDITVEWMAKKEAKGFTVEPRTELLRLGVDLDGTLAEAIWPQDGIGAPRPWAVSKMFHAWDSGYRIWIHTSRPDADYELIEGWLYANSWYHPPHKETYRLSQLVSGIITGKPLFALYIDDRGRHESEESWIP